MCKKEIVDGLQSRNGYTREATLIKFAFHDHLNDSEILLALLRCLNDWVEPIRSLSKKILMQYITLIEPQFLVKHLPNIYHLKSCMRADHNEFIENVELLVSKIPLLPIEFFENNKIAIRHYFFIIQKIKNISTIEKAKWAISTKDIVINGCLSRFIMTFSLEQFKELEPILIKSKNKDLKRELLRLYVKFDIDKINKITYYLFDKSLSVCEAAYYIAKRHNIDVLKIYEEAITNYKLFDINKLKNAIRMVGYLKVKNFLPLLKEIIYSTNIIELKSLTTKTVLKICQIEGLEILINLCMSNNEKDAILADIYLAKIHQISRSFFNSRMLYTNIINAKSKPGKKALVKLIRYFYEWEALYLCLVLYDAFNFSEYQELGILEHLIQVRIDFRNEDNYELKIKEWIDNHPKILHLELFNIFRKSYHGTQFLKTISI